MAELLGKQTGMPVQEAADGSKVQANHVYIIPPNQRLTVAEGKLHLSPPPDDRGFYGAMDTFLCSLAEDQQERAIGIVLSGTGQHGVQGLKAIKAAGGMVIAQRPDTAAYSSMPEAAVDAGVADFVLSPEAMAATLIRYVQHDYVRNGTIDQPATETQTDQLFRILALLRAHIKYDFRHYRKTMLLRRVERRMSLNHIDDVARYLELLRQQPEEANRLFQDLLIGVTEFFREPQAFDVLTQHAVPQWVQRAGADAALRVWVPGCASGEEAYSIAMLLIEQFSAAGRHAKLQIFATDINDDALDKARRGVFSDSAMRNVSAERRRKFFVTSGTQQYHVSKPLRESVVFASQNLLGDAPFSKLDLVSCRNLLIYLEPDAQARVISLFHFALNPGGFLLLGPSETIGRRTNLFETVSKEWRLFRRLETTSRGPIDFAMLPTIGQQRPSDFVTEVVANAPADLDRLTERLLLRGAPAAVLINRSYEILNYHGPTRQYLENPDGPPKHDLLSLGLEGLRAKLRAAVRQAVREDSSVVVEDARVKRDGTYYPVQFTVEPVREPQTDGLLLVTFQERNTSPQRQRRTTGPAQALQSGVEGETSDESGVLSQLEFELRATRDDLQSTVEAQASANEELKAANEEVMSMNEELQSANEELESSKEELQSLNEELATVNSQVESKLEELETANNLVTNLLQSTEYPIVFLDRDFQVRLFTSPAEQLFSLRPTDVGRPISEITPKIKDPTLLDDCRSVLGKLTAIEREVWMDEHAKRAPRDGRSPRCFLRRVLPFRTVDDRIDGVVITLMDLTDRKRAEQAVHAARLHAEAIIATVREPLVVLDANLRVQSANAAFYTLFHVSPDETHNRPLYELGNHQWDIPELRKLLEEMLPIDSQVTDYCVDHEFDRVGWRTMLLNARIIRRDDDRPNEILLAIEDITARVQAEDAVRKLHEQLEHRVAEREEWFRKIFEHAGTGIAITDTNGFFQQCNPAYCQMLGYSQEELRELPFDSLVHPDDREANLAEVERLQTGQLSSFEIENRYIRKNGQPVWVRKFASILRDEAGNPAHLVALVTDVTDRRRQEQTLREREDRLRGILNTASDAIITIDRRGLVTSVNPATEQLFGYTPRELVGQNVSILMPAPYKAEHDGYISRYLATGEPRIIGTGRDLVGRRKDGSTFPIGLAVSEVEHLGLFTGVIRDNSERKRLQRDVLAIAEDEQRRIGRDLHDSTQQELAGLGMLTQTLFANLAKEAVEPRKGSAAKHAELAKKIVDGIARATQQVQTISRGLSPIHLDDKGFMNALSELASRTDVLEGVTCAFKCEQPVEVADSVTATHLYRIAREAVANALKHGHPEHILISLELDDGHPMLQIADDGTGFDSTGQYEGMGLHTMLYRANLIGATLTVSPVESGGTLVTCKVLGGATSND